MRDSGVRCLAAMIVFMFALTGCGDDGGGDEGRSPLAGPPAWWAAKEELGERMQAVHLRAGAPCDVVVVIEGANDGRRTLPPRRLSSGETVRIWWAPDDRPMGPAAGADADAGRTEGHLGGLTFGYADTGAMVESAPMYTRPGRGQVARSSVLPPPTPEPLPFGQETELAVVAVADLEPGRTLTLRPRPEGHRVTPDPDGLQDPERARVLRLKVVVQPAEAR